MADHDIQGKAATGGHLATLGMAREMGAVRVLVAILCVAAGVKLALLDLIGPSFQPDSPGYIAFAQAMLTGRAFRPFDFGAAALPGLAFRMAGYPSVIAAAMLLSARHWADLVVLLQGTATLFTTGIIFTVLRRLFAVRWVPGLVAILYLGSGSLLWDNSIMSDSLYASLFNLVVFALLGDLVGCWRLRFLPVLGLGLLWGLSLLFRDSGLYFTFVPLMLLGAIAWRNADKGWRRILPAIGFVLVVGGAVVGYMAFNWYRTGTAFFAITGVANWLRPVFDMARYGFARPFEGGGIVSAVMRSRPPHYGFLAQLKFLKALHESCACNPVAMNAIVFQKYLATVIRHPFAYLAVIWHNFNYLGLGALLSDPVVTINQFVEYGTHVGHRVIPGLSMHHLEALYAHFSVTELVLMILATITATVSGVLFTLFLFGVPYFAFRAWRTQESMDLPLAVACFSWLSFMGVSLAFSMIHYEARHALPILPAGMTGLAYVLWRLKMRQERRAAA